jgi:hypothetical protein
VNPQSPLKVSWNTLTKLYYTIIAWCNTAVSCSINLWAEKGAIWINGKRYPNPWIPVQSVTGKAHNLSVIQHPSYCPSSNMSSQ